MKINKSLLPYQNIAISGSILLFCVVAVIFAAVPAIGKIQDMIATTRQLSEEAEMLSGKLNVLGTLDETVLREQLTTALSAVPAERSFPTLFETLESVAAQTGVAIQSVNISGGTTLATASASKLSAAEKKLGTRTVSFAVTVEGPIPSIEQFIALTPNVRRLLRIKVFSITFPKNVNTITVTMDMDGFYEPLPGTIGKTTAILPKLTAEDEAVISKLSQFPLATTETTELPPPLLQKMKENPFSP